jgi:hypothetical protein
MSNSITVRARGSPTQPRYARRRGDSLRRRRTAGPNPGGAQAPRRGHGGGTLRRRTPYGQSGSLRGLRLVSPKSRSLVPGERRDAAQSRPPAPQGQCATGTPYGKITLRGCYANASR